MRHPQTVEQDTVKLNKLQKMSDKYWIGTSRVYAAVVLICIHVLVVHVVTGFGGQRQRTSVFSRKADAVKSMRQNAVPRDLYTSDIASTAVYSDDCPPQCRCTFWPDPLCEPVRCLGILLACTNRTTNATSLPHEIDVFLSSVSAKFPNKTVTSLQIKETPLTTIPESVCQLEALRNLVLFENPRLSILTDNCFTRLRELRNFVVQSARLTSLQKGLFDNLAELELVSFSYNRISSIDPHLFDVTTYLPNLRKIYLDNNELTEVDSWPVRRAQLLSGSKIDLSYNSISRFTNSPGWYFDCNSAPLNDDTDIDLTYNNITHLNDMLHGWSITGLSFVLLYL